jgi:hypothetical protein
MTWDVEGIAGEERFVSLVYNETADVLVACFERTAARGYPVPSIYTRHRLDAQYTKVFGPDDVTVAFDVVSASKAPRAFFNVLVVTGSSKPTNEKRASGSTVRLLGKRTIQRALYSGRRKPTIKRRPVGLNWSHVARLDLAAGTVRVVVDERSFKQKHSGAWVSSLVAAADDGGSLLCRIAGAPVGTKGTRVNYSLCRLDLATCDFEVITPLRNTFF